jgi:hypothetical protein
MQLWRFFTIHGFLNKEFSINFFQFFFLQKYKKSSQEKIIAQTPYYPKFYHIQHKMLIVSPTNVQDFE